jgi:hypothetical protein
MWGKQMKTLIAILVLFTVGILPAAAQEDLCYEKGGMWSADEATCIISRNITVDLDYPITLAQHDIVEQTVDTFINETRGQFLSFITAPEMFEFPTSAGYFLSIAYDEYPFSDDITTLVFTISDYTGGAHPNSYYKTFTFDLAGERVLTLDDVFVNTADALTVISPLVQQDLLTQAGDMSDPTWIEQGTGLVPDNYQNFAITPDELIFFFPPYQVAAYAAGPQEVHLPLEQIGSVLAAPFSG